MSTWDDPELANSGEFYEFLNVGDVASGCIKVVRTHTFDDGKKVPQLLMVDDSGDERTLTAGQVRLKAELVEQRPEAGDHLRVTLASIEPRGGGKTLKHFTVQITRGHAPHLAQAAAAAPVQQYVPPAAPVAQPAWANPVAPVAPPAAPPQPVYAPPVAAAPVAPPVQAYAPPVAPPVAPPAPVAAPIPTDPAAAAQAIANLSPEDRARLGIPPQ
jgi:hypothetical protein